MALPKPTSALYTLTIPSTGAKVKYRPFVVREQKALLIAQQSESQASMIDTLKSVVTACVADKIDVDALAVFDLEYIFCQIRGKSVGEFIELFFFCDTCEDENAKVKVSIDITKLEVERFPGHEKNIHLFEDVGVIMRYPSIDVIKRIEDLATLDAELDVVFDIISECIESVYDSNEVHHSKEQTKAEMLEFVNGLTSEQFAKIETFFQTMPKIQQKVAFTCPVCKKAHDKVLRGINNFF